jgi:dTDP-glucose pyrophosphorylase
LSLDAVVIAAGEGRRLRPLTERWAKPVLPIDGRPVIATLMHDLAGAGFDAVTVVVGHLGEQIEELLGDGSAFGLAACYAGQPERLGSADAVSQGLAVGARPPVLVVGADTVFSRGDVGRFIEDWRAGGLAGALAVRHVPVDELPERSSVRAMNGRLVSVVEKPAAGGSPDTLAGAPLWILGAELCGVLEGLPGPPYELAVAAQRAIDAGQEIAAIEIGATRDITHPEDVIDQNFPYLSAWGDPGFPHGPPSSTEGY